AQVSVTFFMAAMPAMGMAAMKTDIQASDKGDGVYEGKGTLGSGGSWQGTITAQQNGKAIASNQGPLQATGGVSRGTARVIEAGANTGFRVVVGVRLLTLAGVWNMRRVPLDALPDISDVEVIIHTNWEGEPPNIIEDQVTYPIVTALLAAPSVKAVRAE